MRRLVGVALLALAAGGCTSVKMVQREGCWVRRTEKVFGRVHEEIGPCGRAQPQWAQDRLTRLVQECVAQADWRWQAKALEAWSSRLAYQPPPIREEVLRTCMEEVRAWMTTELDAANLQGRIADLSGRIGELSGERDALRRDVDQDRAKLHDTATKLADWLGQAAQKPPGNATATATSTSKSDGGDASNESGATLAAESGASAPAAPTTPTAPPTASASSTSASIPTATPAPAVAATAKPSATATAKPSATATAKPNASARVKAPRTRRSAPVVQAARAPSCEPARGQPPCETNPTAEAPPR